MTQEPWTTDQWFSGPGFETGSETEGLRDRSKIARADPDVVTDRGSGLDCFPAKKGLLDNEEFMEIVREVIPNRVN